MNKKYFIFGGKKELSYSDIAEVEISKAMGSIDIEISKALKDAEIEVARANGVAQSNRIISGSIDETYLHYLWIMGLQKNSMEVIYVPTEANMPIMEAGRLRMKLNNGIK